MGSDNTLFPTLEAHFAFGSQRSSRFYDVSVEKRAAQLVLGSLIPSSTSTLIPWSQTQCRHSAGLRIPGFPQIPLRKTDLEDSTSSFCKLITLVSEQQCFHQTQPKSESFLKLSRHSQDKIVFVLKRERTFFVETSWD